jgi:hypothetical protein
MWYIDFSCIFLREILTFPVRGFYAEIDDPGFSL